MHTSQKSLTYLAALLCMAAFLLPKELPTVDAPSVILDQLPFDLSSPKVIPYAAKYPSVDELSGAEMLSRHRTVSASSATGRTRRSSHSSNV